MKEKVKFYGSLFILLIFIPYLVTVYLHGGLPFGTGVDEQTEAQVTARLAAQIPADYEMECLKAQAVIVRTNLYREMEEKNAAEEGWDEAQMREVWGDDYRRNLEKLQEAVEETEGEILTWEGEPIQAAFHVASSGKTRNAAEVPGQEAYTYLQGADSEEDIRRPGFLYIGYMEKAEFAAALQQLFPNETMDAGTLPGALQIVERDSAGYVTRVQYGTTIANGEAVRAALGLNSACFYLSELEGKIRIVTKGIGHGLGFSQYGAEQMAKRGSSYRELLQYYYRDVKIETY